jgi:cytochrome c-type biogenesis protein CcmE
LLLLSALALVFPVSHLGAAPEGYEFSAAVTALPGTTGQVGDWTVGSTTVHVSATTVFQAGQLATIAVGSTVTVEGVLTADGTVTASEILAGSPAPQGYDFSGAVTVLPATSGQIGAWTVGGKTVNVTSSTVFPAGQLATIAVGNTVNVEGILNADGSVTALQIELQGTPSASPSEGYDLHGAVTALPGTTGQIGNWTVAGVTVIVSATTVFPAGQPASIAVGTQVNVNGTLNSDGTVTASKIAAVTPPPANGYHFSGTVTALPGTTGQIGNWTVNGKTVTVTASTLFPTGQLASIAVNSVVEVSGILNADGTITALRISLRNTPPPPASSGYDFEGAITSLPSGGLIGDWVVGAVTVHVTTTTVLPAGTTAIAVGAQVDVHGTLQSDGSVIATSITVVTSGSGGHGH